MSDDGRSDSSLDGEDIGTTGLIATRQKRATAGNFYATLLANLDDEELQKELLAEDEEGDAADYEGSDKDAGDDDEAFESSSDEEDAGPPQEGAPEDLEGEKALKRQERADASKKRKAVDARLKLPAFAKKKKVKLADDVKTEDGSTSERPKKKSERSNWLPTAADAPIRQSGRSLAVANREVIHANLKQSAERSEKQRRVMKDAAQREKTKKRMVEMTQEERLKKCEKIERETAKEFGRWEREEAERQRLREEALAAKRRRGFDGPFIRNWSGSVMWEGDRIKLRRMSHGSKKVEDVKVEKPNQEGTNIANTAGAEDKVPETGSNLKNVPPTTNGSTPNQRDVEAEPVPLPTAASQATTQPPPSQEPPAQPPVSWLQGIQEYAAQPETTYTPSAPALNGASTSQQPPQEGSNPSTAFQPQPPYPPGQVYHGWPSGSHQFTVNPQPLPPPPPPVPLIREQAQRSLLILDQFPSLEPQNTSSKRGPKTQKTAESGIDPTPITNILLPSSYPTLTSEEQKYITTKPRRRAVHGSGGGHEVPLPPPPPKLRCALTSWPAKFRDPKTRLPYADMHQYKVLQRVLAGGCAWSGVLGSWVGPRYGVMGRPARGVPDGFASSGGRAATAAAGAGVKAES